MVRITLRIRGWDELRVRVTVTKKRFPPIIQLSSELGREKRKKGYEVALAIVGELRASGDRKVRAGLIYIEVILLP